VSNYRSCNICRAVCRFERGPANSPLQPTRGRSLARRFRGSVRATPRVAPLEPEGRAPAERQVRSPGQLLFEHEAR
jgi:hypothetical protein